MHYHREGRWRFQRARNVVVAGYAIETPRLLLNSATEPLSRRPRQFLRPGRQEPDGAVEPGGVGHHGRRRSAPTKGPPSLAITEHWNYADAGKDFFGGYAYMSQGPLPIVWSGTQSSEARTCGGSACIDEMEKYNHRSD